MYERMPCVIKLHTAFNIHRHVIEYSVCVFVCVCVCGWVWVGGCVCACAYGTDGNKHYDGKTFLLSLHFI